jgi:C-terminal processing protease CtpA/Prc
MKWVILNFVFMVFSRNMLIAQIPNTISKKDKLYGLSKFWMEANYNFVFLDKVDRLSWDSTYKSLLATIGETKNDYEYFRELQRFCALLKDGHTNIYFPTGVDTLIYNNWFGDYRIYLTNVDGKAIITRVNKSKKDELPVGSEIIEVNGMATADYINKYVAPYISSSTDYVLKDWSIQQMLRSPVGTRYQLKIKKPDSKIITIAVVHERPKEQELYPPIETRKLLDFKWYENKVAYLSLNSFENPKIDTLFEALLPELYNAKALIIDLRFNGGGRTEVGREILKYLTHDSIFYGAKSATRQHTAVYKAWGGALKPVDTIGNATRALRLLNFMDKAYYNFPYKPDTIRLMANRIVVPTVVLMGHNTASAAEDFLIYADRQKHFIKMGENSFGSTGQPYVFQLVGGAVARICTKKDTYPDGREFVGYGIKPDIEVRQSYNDFIMNRDAALEKALEYLKGKK